MKRELNGKELQSYIQQRQMQQVAKISESLKLVIILVGDNALSLKYAQLKQVYGNDISVDVELLELEDANALASTIEQLNSDDSVSGMIVQLPVELDDLQAVLDKIDPAKDVDGLGLKSKFAPATPVAILWLLNGYNIQLEQGRQIVIAGQGKLVGEPLLKLMQASGYKVQAVDENTLDKNQILASADVIISAVGKPGLITSNDIKLDACVVDAGTTMIEGRQVGDVDQSVVEREDVTCTPLNGIGGVGPLTISALFDNLISTAF